MKKKLKTSGELEAELARKSIQNKRYHMKVKESGSVYNRQKNKQLKDYNHEGEHIR